MSQREKIQTSLDAYHSLNAKELNETYKQILSALSVLGEADFETIAAYLKCNPSKIWKRMSELHKMELIYRPGNKRMLKSGRNGFTWMLCNPYKTEQPIHNCNPEKSTDKEQKKLSRTQAELF
jgi:predicted transcriptional regulator